MVHEQNAAAMLVLAEVFQRPVDAVRVTIGESEYGIWGRRGGWWVW